MKTVNCIKWLWKRSEGVRGHIAANAVAGIAYACVSMLFVWVCKKLIDIVTTGSQESLVVPVCIMIACMLAQALLSALEHYVSNKSNVQMKNCLRYRLFKTMMLSRWSGRENFHTGETLNRVMDDTRIAVDSVTGSIPSVIAAMIQFFAAFVFLFVLEPSLAWIIPLALVIMLASSRIYVKNMRRLNLGIRNSEGKIHSFIQEGLQNRLVINSLSKSSYAFERLRARQDILSAEVGNKTRYTMLPRGFILIGFSLGYAAAFLWGVFGIRSGTVTFGMMTAFLQLTGQIQRPVMIMARHFPSLINSITSAERLIEIQMQEVEDDITPIELDNGAGVRFSDVTYAYPDSKKPVLNNFSHDFKAGTITALVGETGIGKSTVMRLILALLHPNSGNVSLYNDNVEVNVSSGTRCNISYVPQGNSLISGTIRENLLLGNPQASQEDIQNALYLATADFVNNLPHGLETICGERGAGLSEGQAQRIAIARSLLIDSPILLLDEPTASLDPQTEEMLIERLGKGLKGRTIIIVTHRENTMNLCEEIVRF